MEKQTYEVHGLNSFRLHTVDLPNLPLGTVVERHLQLFELLTISYRFDRGIPHCQALIQLT